MKIYPIKLTEEQVKAVEDAFPNSKLKFSEKLRALVAGGLSLHQIEWPPTPAHGGKREGSGRPQKK